MKENRVICKGPIKIINKRTVTKEILLLSEDKILSVTESDDVINQTTQNIFIESTLDIDPHIYELIMRI